MQTNLTLRLDQELIKRAKQFAKTNGKSVSQLVADYFSILDAEHQEFEQQIPPVVKSLKGAFRGKEVSIEDYHRYLEEKYS